MNSEERWTLNLLVHEKFLGKKLESPCSGEQCSSGDESYWYCSKCGRDGNWGEPFAHPELVPDYAGDWKLVPVMLAELNRLGYELEMHFFRDGSANVMIIPQHVTCSTKSDDEQLPTALCRAIQYLTYFYINVGR